MISLTWTARASQQYHVESDDYAFSHSAVVHAVEFFFSGDLYCYLYNDFLDLFEGIIINIKSQIH